MDGKTHTAWERASRMLAEHGNATGRQLKRAGLSEEELERAVFRRRLFRPHIGVYAFGYPPTTPKERAMAAVLSCGRWALMSHLWNLSGRTDIKLHRTRLELPRDQCAGSPGRKTTALKALVPWTSAAQEGRSFRDAVEPRRARDPPVRGRPRPVAVRTIQAEG